MTVLSISEAARRCGVARTTLQRAIRAGRLALDARHEVSLEALGHAGYHAARTQQDAAPAQQDQKAGVIPTQQQALLRSMQQLCTQQEEVLRSMQRIWSSLETMQDSLSAMQQGVQQATQQETQQAPGSHAVGEHRAADGDTPTSAKEILLAQIHRWRQDGISLRAIAHKLNTEGVPTWSGKGKWYESNLSRALAARRKTPQAQPAGAQRKE